MWEVRESFSAKVIPKGSRSVLLDHEDGFSRLRLAQCTLGVLTYVISPYVGNSTA